MIMAPRKAGQREMLVESLYSVIALVFVLVTCVELCDGATVVDVYRLIQYDMSGAPFGSRLASLNHHATSLHFSPHADLSRSVLVIPLRELNMTFVKGLIFFRFLTDLIAHVALCDVILKHTSIVIMQVTSSLSETAKLPLLYVGLPDILDL